MLFGLPSDYERAVFAGLTVLVMGYPCALGVSAPLSIVRGAGEAAERGILMRTGEAFQGYRLATHIVFDKTGTLTEGRPGLREVVTIGEAHEEKLLAIAAAAESASEHPLAAAVMAAAMLSTFSFARAQQAGLAGSWSGGGTMVLQSGNAEKVRCRATFTQFNNGASMTATWSANSTSTLL